jgi:uncharacterized protein
LTTGGGPARDARPVRRGATAATERVRPGGPAEHNFARRRRLVAMDAPVSTFEEAVDRIGPKASAIRALGVERLALFGSIVRGQARPDSDADVLVRFATGEKSYDRFLELAYLLEEALGRPIELVTTESLSAVLGPKILAEARDVLRAA